MRFDTLLKKKKKCLFLSYDSKIKKAKISLNVNPKKVIRTFIGKVGFCY